jgi:hypothetical protein
MQKGQCKPQACDAFSFADYFTHLAHNRPIGLKPGSGVRAPAFALPARRPASVTPLPARFWPQVIETKELVVIHLRHLIENK